MAHPAFRLENSLRDQLFGRILGSLEKLPEPLRQVFTRTHYQGQDAGRIARDLGLLEENVAVMLSDAEHLFYRNLDPSF